MTKKKTHGGARVIFSSKSKAGRIPERFPFLAPDDLYITIKEKAAEHDLSINQYLLTLALNYEPKPGDEEITLSFTQPLKQRFVFRASEDDYETIKEKAARLKIIPNRLLLRAFVAMADVPNVEYKKSGTKETLKRRFDFRCSDSFYPKLESRARELGKSNNEYLLSLAEADIEANSK